MSLYDDIDAKEKPEEMAGWASGIKMLHSHVQLKKATQTQSNREKSRKSVSLAPVVDLKSRKDDDGPTNSSPALPIIPTAPGKSRKDNRNQNRSVLSSDPEWQVDNEYDPVLPNDYERVVRELKNQSDSDRGRRGKDEDRESRRSARERPKEPEAGGNTSGFSRVPGQEEEDDEDPTVRNRRAGAAIAPPPSLQDEAPDQNDALRPDTPPPPSLGTAPPGAGFSIGGVGGTIAAKIMAKYGYKEGQGLGKSEQGIATALQVEKTSKRGGRIIQEPKTETAVGPEAMKNPSKVVLLLNMVGPGEVDNDLEPEVKDECSTKYGDVTQCVICELSSQPESEAVRIFVEFKRQESAIKAVVDLNGRYFGGRMVKASFYAVDKFKRMELAD